MVAGTSGTSGAYDAAVAGPDGVELFWIPLGAGAGGALVRWSGRRYEALQARRQRRPPRPLFHSALRLHDHGTTTVVEMAPVWTGRGPRGVVVEGPVGAAGLGRWRLFRYEVRCWPGGTIPDLAAAVGGPVLVSDQAAVVRRVVDAAPSFPALTWGRDELGTGDMWNSNSLISWLLAGAGAAVEHLAPPCGGRAPGWRAGLVAAGGVPGARA